MVFQRVPLMQLANSCLLILRSFLFSFLSILLLSSCQSRSKAKIEGDELLSTLPGYLKPLIILDAGHGGKDIGASSKRYSIQEKQLSLKTAKQVATKLEKLGYSTVLVRKSDRFIELDERVNIANRYPGGLFVSIHFNSARNPLAEGIEIYYFERSKPSKRDIESKRLSSCILDAAIAKTRAGSRGVRLGAYRVIKNTNIPSCLVEGGFITCPREARRLASSSYIDKLSSGIAAGIDTYARKKAFKETSPKKMK